MRVLAAVLVTALALPGTTKAEEPLPVEDIPPGDDVIEVLRQGQPAPFTGQLFEPATALRWANWLQQYKLRLRIDMRKERDLCAAEVEYVEQLRSIEKGRNRQVERDLNARLVRSEDKNAKLADELANPSFWKSMEFGLILGVVSSAAVAVSIGIATGSL